MDRYHLPHPVSAPVHRLGLLLEASALAVGLVVLLLFFFSGQAQAALGPTTSQRVRAQALTDGLSWQVLAPTGWAHSPVTCTVQVTNTAGFDISQPVICRYSTDGGSSWAEIPATAAFVGPLTTTVQVSAAHIPLISSADQNLVLFLINDATDTQLQVPNDGSPGLAIKVDNEAPALPTGLAASPTGWTNVNGAFAVTWTNPPDVSGIVKAHYKLDTAPSGPHDGVTVAGDDIHSLSNLNVSDAGKHSIYVWLEDAAGNVGNTSLLSDAFQYDPTPPTSSAQLTGTLGSNGWYRSSIVTATLSASDPLTGCGVISALHWQLDAAGWLTHTFAAAPYTWSVPVTGQGTHTLSYRATDGVGNLQAELGQSSLKIDSAPPTVSELSLSGKEGTVGSGWFISPVTVTVPAADPTPGSDVAQVYYRLDNASQFLPAQSFAVAGEGVHTVSAYAVDNAGNVGAIRTFTDAVKIDFTAPAVTPTFSPPNAAGWYTSSVAVTLTAQDVAASGIISSGVRSVAYQIDGNSWVTVTGKTAFPPVSATDGVHTLSYRAQDMAGNVSTARQLTFRVDTQKPTASASFDGRLGANGWYTSTGAATLAGTDQASGSGMKQLHYRLDAGQWQTKTASTSQAITVTLAITTEGVHTLTVQAEDVAGNLGDIVSKTLRIDTTPPTLIETRSSQPNQFGWYNGSNTPVSVTLGASDVVTGVATSGVDRVEYRQLPTGTWQTVNGPLSFSAENKGDYEARARDLAGNISATHPFTVYIDKTAPPAPVAPLVISPTTWTNVNSFDATWTNPDDFSGIAAAYYTVDALPGHGTANGPVTVTVTPDGKGHASGLHVPGDGQHWLFLWLVDKAGNSSSSNASYAPNYLYYDHTPPTNAHATVEGTQGRNGYYVTPVHIHLQADDATSGVAAFTYLTSTQWVTETVDASSHEVVVDLPDDGKWPVYYKAIDNAGNVGPITNMTVTIDQTPPGAPVNLTVETVGWSRAPTFTVSWSPPSMQDLSGIPGGLYTLNKAPTKTADGAPSPIVRSYGGRYYTEVTVPQEGVHTLYYWLQDGAGNSDPATAVTRTVKYDGTPPTTTITPDRPPDYGPWYNRPVTLTFGVTDSVSGVQTSAYTVNGGSAQPMHNGVALPLTRTGIYTISYGARDMAGNQVTHTQTISLDMAPPTTWVSAPINAEPGFTVRWGASDAPSNAVSSYWVQYRDNGDTWTNWQTATSATSASFTGARGHRYDFQVRARDAAGNESDWVQATTYVDPLQNDGFADGLTGWQVISVTENVTDPWYIPHDWQATVTTTADCGAQHALLLGSPDYGPSPFPDNFDPTDRSTWRWGTVPQGAVTATQTVHLPQTRPGDRIWLSFRYRVMSYDTMNYDPGGPIPAYIGDTFDANVLATDGVHRVVRSGCPLSQWVKGQKWDSGCQSGIIELTKYAGQDVQLQFANWNRWDHYWNTYSYVYNVEVQVFGWATNLPLTQRNSQATSLLGQTQSVAPMPTIALEPTGQSPSDGSAAPVDWRRR